MHGASQTDRHSGRATTSHGPLSARASASAAAHISFCCADVFWSSAFCAFCAFCVNEAGRRQWRVLWSGSGCRFRHGYHGCVVRVRDFGLVPAGSMQLRKLLMGPCLHPPPCKLQTSKKRMNSLHILDQTMSCLVCVESAC